MQVACKIPYQLYVRAILISILSVISVTSFSLAQQTYSTINKFLQAKMFCDAYYEILKLEISQPKFDQKLLDLKKQILNLTLKEAEKRQKVNPSDEAVYTILADIYLQKGQLNEAVKYISVARQSNPNALVHYTFAKILFNKGNISQAFDEMEKALIAEPSSEVIFDDFQFLYNCKNNGLASAQRLSIKENNFLKRAIPLNKDLEIAKLFQNPFNSKSDNNILQNVEDVKSTTSDVTSDNTSDITLQSYSYKTSFSEYEDLQNSNFNTSNQLSNQYQIDSDESSLPKDKKENTNQTFPKSQDYFHSDLKKENKNQNLSLTLQDQDNDNYNTTISQHNKDKLTKPNNFYQNFSSEININNLSQNIDKSNKSRIKTLEQDTFPSSTKDPENEKLNEAYKYLQIASESLSKNNIIEAQEYIKKAKSIIPDYPPVLELESRIQNEFDLDNRFKNAKMNFENNKYNLAVIDFEKVYNSNPDKYHEAALYLGKIYVLCPDCRDLKKAKYYFEKFISKDNIDPNIKRDVEWIIIGVLADDEEFIEAYQRFIELEKKESDFVRSQNTYWKLKYTLWFNYYKMYIVAAFSAFIGMFFLIIILKIAPYLQFWSSDPVKVAKEAMNNLNYSKAAEIANNALLNSKLDLSAQKTLYEISIQSNYNLRNFVKCIEMAQSLLKISPENNISYKYIAKSFLATNDTSPNAISYYEKAYKLYNDKEFLPVLANYYIKKRILNEESLDIIFQYFQTNPKDKSVCQTLADVYTQNKKMGDDVILVLEEAVNLFPEKNEYKELLARNYVKKGMYLEASRICLEILKHDINNTGIHVVYTTCMKKMNLVEEAILQYEEFLQKYPKNQQLYEIIQDLKKESIHNKDFQEEYSSVDLHTSQKGGFLLSSTENNYEQNEANVATNIEPLEALDINNIEFDINAKSHNPTSDQEIEGLTELAIPEATNNDIERLPIPEFIKKELENKNDEQSSKYNKNNSFENKSSNLLASSHNDLNTINTIPLLDPFSDQFEPINIEELKHFKNSSNKLKPSSEKTNEAAAEELTSIFHDSIPDSTQNSTKPAFSDISSSLPTSSSTSQQTVPQPTENLITKAKELIKKRKWQEIIDTLSPIFATKRSLEVGLILAEAYLSQNNPLIAKQIIDSIDFDREIMPEIVKETSYKIALALEQINKIEEALELYDMICNVDINYKDAFERSDRLYTLKKQLHSKN